MSKDLFGVGCTHVGVECCVTQMNKFLTHYGGSSNLGFLMRMSVNFLILEMGISIQPLQELYSKNEYWITRSWLKTLWEKYGKFGISVDLNDIAIGLPQVRDKWLMREFLHLRFSKHDLERLNRVRIYSQVLFLSEILGASGKMLDTKYENR